MQDPEEQQAYNDRKEAKREKRQSTSVFSYSSAGGEYVPTKFQHDQALRFLSEMVLTTEQESACNMVMYGFSCQEKVRHDEIHIVNELYRTKNQTA